MHCKKIQVLFILVLWPFCLVAQDTDSVPGFVQNTPLPTSDSLANTSPTVQQIEPKKWWQEMLTDTEFMNSGMVMFFGFLTLLLIIRGAKAIQGGFKPAQYIRMVVIMFIIIASMFLIAAGFDNKQVAPVFGLLGTIAGYLLGRSDYLDEKSSSNNNPPPNQSKAPNNKTSTPTKQP